MSIYPISVGRDKKIEEIEEAAWLRMAPVVSHELRNPIAAISNSVYFIRAKLSAAGPLEPKIEKHLNIIASEIARSDGILSEILSYARMPRPVPAATSLSAVVEAALGAAALPESLAVDKKAADAPLKADLKLLAKAVAHLLRNAADATDGAAGRRVRLEASVAGKEALIRVSDTGPGIPAQDAEAVFLPFFTTKPRGVGLGLAFARKAAELHGGRLTLEKPGPGAVFALSVPL